MTARWVWGGPCEDALIGEDVPGHGACYGEYRETKTISCHPWSKAEGEVKA